MTKKPVKQTKNDDLVAYLVLLALLLAGGSMLGLRSLGDYYFNHIALVPMALPMIILAAGAALTVLSLVFVCIRKWKVVSNIAVWTLVVGFVTFLAGLTLKTATYDGFRFLYYVCLAFVIQYIIYQLYRWEFFLLSLSTVLAGGVFFCFSQGMYFTGRNVIMLVLLVLSLLGTFGATWMASKNKGILSFGKTRVRLFNAKSLPILICIADALWLVCTVAMLFLGGLFAYYCMFAAIAVEFVAAVYYTFQLN